MAEAMKVTAAQQAFIDTPEGAAALDVAQNRKDKVAPLGPVSGGAIFDALGMGLVDAKGITALGKKVVADKAKR